MKVLIVDNNLYVRGYPQGLMLRAHLALPYAVTARVRQPRDLTERDVGVDRVILSGSTGYIREEREWMVQERRFIEGWMKRGVPILGICFGAQLLARHIFGQKAISALPIPISGSILMEHRAGCRLFEGLPNPCGVVSTHYEGFVVPEEQKVAWTDEWPCYGFAHPGEVYGVQFHPELLGPVGRGVVRLQRAVYDRHVFQDLEVPTSTHDGVRLLKNFLDP